MSLLHNTPSCSCFAIPFSMLLHLSLPELFLWCYCSFNWREELRDELVPIQSQRPFISFDQWYHQHPSWNAECFAPVSCQVQQHWRNLEMFLLQTFILWTLSICFDVNDFFSFLFYQLISTFSICLPTSICFQMLYHLWCCNWPVCKCFIQRF